MLIPVGQEDDTVRRIPWVTISIMAVCVLMHLIITGTVRKSMFRYYDIQMEYSDYYQQ